MNEAIFYTEFHEIFHTNKKTRETGCNEIIRIFLLRYQNEKKKPICENWINR